VIIGFIPARGGSKGIPNKNLARIGNRSLLEIGIEKLKLSGCDQVYVSTDSKEIMSKASECGASVIVRPKIISGDDATTESAIQHFLSTKRVCNNDLVVLHQLTSPFLRVSSVKACIETLLFEPNWNSCFTALDRHAFTWELQVGKGWNPINHSRNVRIRRQDLPERVIESGGAYVFRVEEFRSQFTRYAEPSTIVKIGFLENFEIDSPSELSEANYIYDRLGEHYAS
jgi:N-acylneuraminate cytidylyltransferase